MAGIEKFDVTDPNPTHLVIELFGGDNNLSDYILEDLQEMAAGNKGRFVVLALADFLGDGGQVIELSRTKGLRVLENTGEINTGDPETLAAFIARALVTYKDVPHVALGFWDHGSGVFEENDPNEKELSRALSHVSRRSVSRSLPARHLFVAQGAIAADEHLRAMLHDKTQGDLLTNYEAYGVVRAALERASFTRKLDVIFSDTCLNGMVEVLDQFKEFATVVVGSEELEPGDGWDYERLFRMMSDKPPASATAWGEIAVAAFETGYRHRPNQFPCTLAAFRSENDVTKTFGELVAALAPAGKDGFRLVNGARATTQGFAQMDTYDIRDFAKQVADASDGDINKAATKLAKAVDDACIRSAALGDDVGDAHGLAFWFPSNRRAFKDTAGTYRRLAFDESVHWADYLATHLL